MFFFRAFSLRTAFACVVTKSSITPASASLANVPYVDIRGAPYSSCASCRLGENAVEQRPTNSDEKKEAFLLIPR